VRAGRRVLEKPFEPDEMLAAVRARLADVRAARR
jgi:DNA-binding response OmpR family regulator